MSNSVRKHVEFIKNKIEEMNQMLLDGSWKNEVDKIEYLEEEIAHFKKSLKFYEDYYSLNKPKKPAKALRPSEAPEFKELRYVTFDLESENWKDFLCLGFYDIENDYFAHYETIEESVVELFKYCKKENINNVFAHNGGKFDFLFILDGAFKLKNSDKFKFEHGIPRGSGILSLEVIYLPLKKKLTFRDSLHFLPSSLRKLGESYQVETPKDDIDYQYLGNAFRNEDYLEKIFSDTVEDRNDVAVYRNKVFYKDKHYDSYKSLLRSLNGSKPKKEFIRYHILKDVMVAEKDIYQVENNPIMSKEEKEKLINKIKSRIMIYRIYNKEDVISYLKIDCVCLAQIMRNHFASPIIRDAGVSFTSAGQAVKIFKRYLKHVIYPSTPEEDAFVRKAYLGGRTELFKFYFNGEYDFENNPQNFKKETLEVIKKQQGKVIHCYDANSLYPSQMMANKYPLKFVGMRAGQKFYDHYEFGVWRVKVKIPYMEIPPLGLQKTFSNGERKLVFPANGIYEGHWTKQELEYARTLGVEILEYYEGACYSNGEYVFKEFIETMYNARLEARARNDGTTAEICKLAMNSCYGKLGQSPEERHIIVQYSNYIGQDPISIYTTDRQEVNFCKMVSNTDSMFSKVILACYVTSYARIYMHKQIMKVGSENIYYMDTDSLFTTEEMESGNKLCEMKHEYTYKSAVFILPKAYAVFDGMGDLDRAKKVLKGVDREQGQTIPITEIVEYFKGDIAELKTIRKQKFMTCGESFGQNVFLGVSGNPTFEQENISHRIAVANKELEKAIKAKNKKLVQVIKNKLKTLKERYEKANDKKFKSIKKKYDKRIQLPDLINTIPLGGGLDELN